MLLGEIIENRGTTMDFMFEDDVDEVGSDVEAYCPKCKADTTHVVISKYEDEIRRVQCNPCGDVHSFRKPRGESEEDIPEPVAARKRALLKKLTWEEFFAKHGERNAKPYEFRDTYRENAIVYHPKFGKGYVSEVVSESKVEITFSDARRILVHNRKDIPGSPVGREDDGLPSTTAVVKVGGKGAAKAVDKQAAPPKASAAAKEPAKKPEEKKGAPKRVAAEKAPATKKPATGAAAKKPAAKKAPAKKPAAKKAPAKKPAAKKAPAKKPAAKKAPAKKNEKKKSSAVAKQRAKSEVAKKHGDKKAAKKKDMKAAKKRRK